MGTQVLIAPRYLDVTHLDDPARPPEVPELAEPVVYLVHLDAHHVPEPGQVLAGRHEGVLLPAHVLKQASQVIKQRFNFWENSPLNSDWGNVFVGGNLSISNKSEGFVAIEV